ncbi:unnamed protein product, partial [Urochloa humidicola]
GKTNPHNGTELWSWRPVAYLLQPPAAGHLLADLQQGPSRAACIDGRRGSMQRRPVEAGVQRASSGRRAAVDAR